MPSYQVPWNYLETKLVQLIEKSVQVNYHLVEKSDYQVAVEGIWSVWKFGRLKIVKDNGQTKRRQDKIKHSIIIK